MGAAVEPLPGRRVGEPEVGAAVDDHDRARPSCAAIAAGLAVRQREEDDVVAGERLGVVSSSTRSASGTRCGWRRAERLARVGRAGQRADLDLGVRQEQAEQLAAGVPAGSGDGDPVIVMCMTIQRDVCACESGGRDPGWPGIPYGEAVVPCRGKRSPCRGAANPVGGPC